MPKPTKEELIGCIECAVDEFDEDMDAREIKYWALDLVEEINELLAREYGP